MFGYVTFYKDELKIKDYNKFRAYYCGLCKELGSRYNHLVRLGLSYDLTFLALVLDSVDKKETEFSDSGCLRHIGRKVRTVSSNPYVQYASDMSIALVYYKLKDDIRDGFSPLSWIGIIPYFFAVKKVKKMYPDKICSIKDNLEKLSQLERDNCPNTDEAADPFAKIMECLFDIGDDNLKSLGYNIGRFIYIADAVDDYEKDVEKVNYNPFRFSGDDFSQIKDIAQRSMSTTLAMAAKNYENLKITKNKDLLDNIIYLGLRQRMDMVLSCDKCKKKGDKNGKSL